MNLAQVANLVMAYQIRSRRGVMIAVTGGIEIEPETRDRLETLSHDDFWAMAQGIIDASMGAVTRIIKDKVDERTR
jgi:hypothetical protein